MSGYLDTWMSGYLDTWMMGFLHTWQQVCSISIAGFPGGLILDPLSFLDARVLQLLLQGAPHRSELLLGALRGEAENGGSSGGGARAAQVRAAAVDGGGASVVPVLVVVHEVVESHDLIRERLESVQTSFKD